MVSFGQAMKMCLKSKLFNFHDRAPRSEYWWLVLGSILALIPIIIIMTLVPVVGFILAVVCGIWLFLGGLSASVRRFHDLNLSGWWILGIWVINLILGILTVLSDEYFFEGLSYVISFAYIVVCILPGSKNDNRFGPDPLGKITSLPKLNSQSSSNM